MYYLPFCPETSARLNVARFVQNGCHFHHPLVALKVSWSTSKGA
jgi:hypothetical protein